MCVFVCVRVCVCVSVQGRPWNKGDKVGSQVRRLTHTLIKQSITPKLTDISMRIRLETATSSTGSRVIFSKALKVTP